MIEITIGLGIVWHPNRQILYTKKGELGSLINKNMIKEELDVDIELDRMDDNSGDENPYKKLIINNACKIRECITPNRAMVNP